MIVSFVLFFLQLEKQTNLKKWVFATLTSQQSKANCKKQSGGGGGGGG